MQIAYELVTEHIYIRTTRTREFSRACFVCIVQLQRQLFHVIIKFPSDNRTMCRFQALLMHRVFTLLPHTASCRCTYASPAVPDLPPWAALAFTHAALYDYLPAHARLSAYSSSRQCVPPGNSHSVYQPQQPPHPQDLRINLECAANCHHNCNCNIFLSSVHT